MLSVAQSSTSTSLRSAAAAGGGGSVPVPGPLWSLGRLNHVAIAVPDLEKATALYRDVLGARVSERVALPEHGVYTVFVELGNTKLELLHPLGEKSPIAGFLQKNKAGGMHHICMEVRETAGLQGASFISLISPPDSLCHTDLAGDTVYCSLMHNMRCILSQANLIRVSQQ